MTCGEQGRRVTLVASSCLFLAECLGVAVIEAVAIRYWRDDLMASLTGMWRRASTVQTRLAEPPVW